MFMIDDYRLIKIVSYKKNKIMESQILYYSIKTSILRELDEMMTILISLPIFIVGDDGRPQIVETYIRLESLNCLSCTCFMKLEFAHFN